MSSPSDTATPGPGATDGPDRASEVGVVGVLAAGVLLAGWAGLAEGLVDMRGQDVRTRADAAELLGYAVSSWQVPALLCAAFAGVASLLLCAVARRLRAARLSANLFGGSLAALCVGGAGVAPLVALVLGALVAGVVLPWLGRVQRLAWSAVFLVLVTWACGASIAGNARDELPAASGAGRPLVVLVVVDALRADALSCYRAADVWSGVELTGADTPHLDALAADGWLVPDALSSSSWTLPAVASLLTGLSPRRHGVTDHDSLLPEGLATLPELFGAAGYRSGAVVGNPILRPDRGFLRGFDVVSRQPHEFEASLRWILRLNEVAVRRGWITGPDAGRKLALPTLVDGRPTSRRTGYLAADEVTDAGLALVDELGHEDALLYLHYFDPHDPYREHPAPLFPRHPPWDEVFIDELGARYDGEVAFFDEHFGRLVDGLRARGAWDDAVVVVTADHGEEFLDHGGWRHGASLYDELVRVPLIVRFPGGRVPADAPDTASLVDVLPTLLRAAGVEAPGVGEGLDLVARAAGRAPDDERRFTERVQDGLWLAGVRDAGGDLIASLPTAFGLTPQTASAWADVVRARLDRHGLPDPEWERTHISGTADDLLVPPGARDRVVTEPLLQLLPAATGPQPVVRTRPWTPRESGWLSSQVSARCARGGQKLRVFMERRRDDGWELVPESVAVVEGAGQLDVARTVPFLARAGEPVRVGLGTLPPDAATVARGDSLPVENGWTISGLELAVGDPLHAFRYEVYDRAVDPTQVASVPGFRPADLADVLALLDYFAIEGEAATRALDDGELERFREIGYLGDDDG